MDACHPGGEPRHRPHGRADAIHGNDHGHQTVLRHLLPPGASSVTKDSTMKPLTNIFLAIPLLTALGSSVASGQGFTEPDVLFYGEVRKSGGGQTVLLQSGQLEMTFVNQSN